MLNTLESKLTRYNTNCNITRIMLSKHQTCIATALIALSLRRAHGDKAPPARPHRLADTTPLITAALMCAAIHTNARPCARVACVCHPYACAQDPKQLRQSASLRALGDFRTPHTRRHTTSHDDTHAPTPRRSRTCRRCIPSPNATPDRTHQNRAYNHTDALAFSHTTPPPTHRRRAHHTRAA